MQGWDHWIGQICPNRNKSGRGVVECGRHVSNGEDIGIIRASRSLRQRQVPDPPRPFIAGFVGAESSLKHHGGVESKGTIGSSEVPIFPSC